MTKQGIIDFISKQRTSLISSVDENGYPATRALIQPVLVDGNDIYFATYTSSRKVKHYRNNPRRFPDRNNIVLKFKLSVIWERGGVITNGFYKSVSCANVLSELRT